MVLSTHTLAQEHINPQDNSSSTTRSRFPSRIPRLIRRPQTTVYRDAEGNLLERASSISSAISITRTSSVYNSTPEDLNDVYDLHCVTDEQAVDLASVCQVEIGQAPTNKNYVSLEFEVISSDGGQYSPTYNVENVLRNDGTVYCSEKCGTINILLRYKGSNRGNKGCVLSHIVIKSPSHGFTAPCKEGMIFLSHTPIDISSTRVFDSFTKERYDTYSSTNANHPIAWFTASKQRLSIINMKEQSCKYVLIKLLRADLESSENMDLQYIGLVGYFGSRCFAKPCLF